MPLPYDVPFRDTFWNVPPWAQFLLYALSLVAIGVFALGLWQRVALWRDGKPENRWDRIPERVSLVVRHGLLQGRTLSQRYPGIMHALIFWGFCVLFLGTVLATLDYDIAVLLFDAKLLKGPFYLVYELSLDAFGLFFVLGLAVALYRRFVQRPKRIDPTPHFAGDPRPAAGDQRHRLRRRGVPAGGRRAVVGPVVVRRLGAGAGAAGARPDRGRAPRPPPRDVALPLRRLVRVHRASSRTPTSST